METTIQGYVGLYYIGVVLENGKGNGYYYLGFRV